MVCRWFRLQHPKFNGHLFAIPNGSHLAGDAKVRAIKMHKMKEEGFVPGVADLFLMVPIGGWHGLFIEMKKSKGVQSDVSDVQREFLGRANLIGYRAEVCFGFDQARVVIDDYLRGVA